ncbi:hypothetical protein GCM10017691_24080 [Pseudonocardia petroleophila]|uniref:HNH endonuclease n=1 Tax=Pseudonocardia petroleophila TaxID=37331 RepID=A0A7G7MFT6_9PSEU|nr:HNH endonuclease [Pseudonocardia petroleophila]QNG51647.1 HNH endonuclease [Pseudonocardia petroleophila]
MATSDVPVTRNAEGMRICNTEGCDGKHRARGMCVGCFNRSHRAAQKAAGLSAATGAPLRNRPRAGRICVVGDCPRAVHAGDWCHSHYKSHAPRSRSCTRPGCAKPFHAQGLCSDHYEAARRSGHLDVVRPVGRPVAERFADYQAAPDAAGCRVWVGSIDKYSGRGSFTLEGSQATQAHRAAWLLQHGDLPVDEHGKSLPFDHMCRVGRCTNPGHLQPVTTKENSRRGMVASGHRPITAQDPWFWVALNAWRHGADNFPARVVSKPSRVKVIQISDGQVAA